MKRFLICIITVTIGICTGIFLFGCAEKSTYNVMYSGGVGGTVKEVKEDGSYGQTSPWFKVREGEDAPKVTAIPKAGYGFEKWSDGATEATRQDTNISSNINIQALFYRTEYFVTYTAVTMEGYIDGETKQTVKPGGDAQPVTVHTYTGYIFEKWSDGVTEATRHDTNITSDKDISAIFKKEEYAVNYTTDGHGSIDGTDSQSVKYKEDGSAVTAVPDKGYVFVKWSDGVTEATRTETNITSEFSVTAEFAPKTRECKLNDRITLNSVVNKPTITLTYDALSEVKLPVPEREHFIFDGWYYRKDKIADENGNLLITDDFILEEPVIKLDGREDNDLLAKWKAKETFTYRILLVYVTRIQARLRDRNRIMHDIDFTMSELQRRFCEESTKLLRKTMNEMVDGLVDFQIDEYYTTQTITNEQLSQSYIEAPSIYTHLFPKQIPEVRDMAKDYGSTISVFGFDGDQPTSASSSLFQNASGTAGDREGQVHLDSLIYGAIVDEFTLSDVLNADLDGTDRRSMQIRSNWLSGIGTFIHEIAHTIEQGINAYSYHRASVSNANKYNLDYYITNGLYYTNSIEADGKLVGIPYEFWKGDVATVVYESNKDTDNDNMGYVITNESHNTTLSGKLQNVVYGWDAIAVKATPFPGYRFVRWSDGLTTPDRKDRNITADLTVTAIFEPIIYTVRVVAGEGGSVEMTGEQHNEIILHVKIRQSTEYIIAVAHEGYVFTGWSDGTSNIYWSKFFQITEIDLFDENNTYTVTAIFKKTG